MKNQRILLYSWLQEYFVMNDRERYPRFIKRYYDAYHLMENEGPLNKAKLEQLGD